MKQITTEDILEAKARLKDQEIRNNTFNFYRFRYSNMFTRGTRLTALDLYKRLKGHYGNRFFVDLEYRLIAKNLLAYHDYELQF